MPGLFNLLKNLLGWSDDGHKRILQNLKSQPSFDQKPRKRRQINMSLFPSVFAADYSEDENENLCFVVDEQQLSKRQIRTRSFSKLRISQKIQEQPCKKRICFNSIGTRQQMKILGTTFNHLSSLDRSSYYLDSRKSSPLSLLSHGRFNEASTSKTKSYHEMSVIGLDDSNEEEKNPTLGKGIMKSVDEKYKARRKIIPQEIKDQMKVTNMLNKSHQPKRDIEQTENQKKSLRLSKRMIDKPKLPILTPEMLQQVDEATNPLPAAEVLSSNFGLQIRQCDIETLSKKNWLNDVVINFYMNLLIERGRLGGFPKVYAMNTFFYPKLISSGYSSLMQWTRKIDIFSYDMVVVPIHLEEHWCMAIIDFREKKIKYFDSMGRQNKKCLRALKKYLEEESLDKKKKRFGMKDWKFKCMEKIPLQKNSSDCGVFSCMFAEYASRRQPYTFSQKNMPYFRKKMTYEILKCKLL